MTKHAPDLNLIFHALADPTRRAMLARLIEGPVPVSQLAQPTGLALPTVLRHLTVLEGAALIETRKAGRIRTCHARPTAIAAAEDWLAAQRALWAARTDRLEALLAELETDDAAAEPRA